MKKLHIGCGLDYKQGFVNLDGNKLVKADIYCDLNKKLPFKENEFDYVYSSHTFEHVKEYLFFLDEVYRICKPGAIIEILVPHFTSIYATKYPTHYNQFGIGSFVFFTSESSDKQKYNHANFLVLKETLSFALHNTPFFPYKLLNKFNFFWNINKKWQNLMERFQIFGFDEIYYKLKVIKD